MPYLALCADAIAVAVRGELPRKDENPRVGRLVANDELPAPGAFARLRCDNTFDGCHPAERVLKRQVGARRADKPEHPECRDHHARSEHDYPPPLRGAPDAEERDRAPNNKNSPEHGQSEREERRNRNAKNERDEKKEENAGFGHGPTNYEFRRITNVNVRIRNSILIRNS